MKDAALPIVLAAPGRARRFIIPTMSIACLPLIPKAHNLERRRRSKFREGDKHD